MTPGTTRAGPASAPPRAYLRLPIDPAEGFPQSFRLDFRGQVYQVSLHVNVSEEGFADRPDPLDLCPPIATARKDGGEDALPPFLVMRVLRETPDGSVTIFQRRLVCNHEYEAAELAFRFTRIQVAKSNLNGAGAFGSIVEGGVAARWAS